MGNRRVVATAIAGLLLLLSSLSLAQSSVETASPPDEVAPSAPGCSSPQWDLDTGGGVSLHCWNNVYVVSVDLQSPDVEVRAAESSRPNPLSSVADDGDTIAVINGDYTNDDCVGTRCAQGLFYIAGDDKTNRDKLCTDARKRRVLAVSSGGQGLVDWWYALVDNPQSVCPGLAETGGWATSYRYHVVGGGPQFTFDGSWRWDAGTCVGGDYTINGEHFKCDAAGWLDARQTAVGLTTDRNRLLFAVSNGVVNLRGVHDVLYAVADHHGQRLQSALKYDGGSKSGLYYRRNPGYSINPSVPVANAWVVRRRTGPPPPPPPPAGDWRVDYYSDLSLGSRCSGGSESGTYALKDWGDGSPASGCPADNWSARLSRRVRFQSGWFDFALGSDDWARLKVDGEVVVDNWPPASYHYAGKSLSEGEHDVTVEFADTAGAAKLTAWWRGPGFEVPQDSRDPAQWYAHYWGNRDLWWDAIAKRNEGGGPLSHDWGSGGPGWGIPTDRFSAKFERRVFFQCGQYTFRGWQDDGARVYIDDRLVHDRWQDTNSPFEFIAQLAEGDHELRVEYYENGGGARIELDWAADAICTPIATPTRTPTPTATPTDTPTSTPSPTYTLTSTPTLTPEVTLTPTPAVTETPTLSPTPTDTLTPVPTEPPTPVPTEPPTPIPTAAPQPDLVVAALSNPPASTAPGGSFSVTDYTLNVAASRAGASTNLYFLSTDRTLGGGDQRLGGSRSVPALRAYRYSKGTTVVMVQAGTPLVGHLPIPVPITGAWTVDC